MGNSISPQLAVAMTVAQGVANYAGERKASKVNQQAAQAAYEADIEALNDRAVEERNATTEQMVKNARQALVAKGQARVKGADAGINITTLLHDLGLQASENEATLGQNFLNTKKQINREAKASANTAQGRMNQVPRPNLLAHALNTGLNATSTYYTVSAAQAAAKGPSTPAKVPKK